MAKAIEAALDELYAATPADFVATRKRLAKKHPGLAKRRKPTQTAYALNQLARRHPDAIADLVDAGRALARAQRKAMRGTASGLREAIERQRTVIRERMQEVARLVTDLGVDEAHLPEIARALQAALVDAGVGEQLEEGHLERVPEATGGLFSLTPADETRASGARAPRKKKKKKTAETKSAKASTAAAARRAASEEKAAAKRAAAEQRAAAKKKRADERRAAIAEAESRADALAKAARAAEAEATKARDSAVTAKKAASAAAAALARLRRAR